MKFKRIELWCVAAFAAGLLGAVPALAREAAFADPGTGSSHSDDAVKVEPKGEIDVGESNLNTVRQTTLFFVNQTNAPVQVESVAVNNDGNVTAAVTNDDCTKQGAIPPQSRCSVEVSVTPTSPGPWSVEALLTHNGAGRIARAKIIGKTTGDEKKDTGLALTTKEVNPINFGTVEIGNKAVRSALMVNDSPDPITIFSIDVIEADNGLLRLDQGCAVDMELKPGESCPVTLSWAPTQQDEISTDLIIRHSGRLGFAVIPIRGKTHGEATAGNNSSKSDSKSASDKAPPTADELDKAMAGKVEPIAVSAMPSEAPPPAKKGTLHLIGTVGSRAVMLLPDGTTSIVSVGDSVKLDDDKSAEIAEVNPQSANVIIDGKNIKLKLEVASELTAKAEAREKAENTKFGMKETSASLSASTTPPSRSLAPGASPPPPSAPSSTSVGQPSAAVPASSLNTTGSYR